jgi:hypothetical protein
MVDEQKKTTRWHGKNDVCGYNLCQWNGLEFGEFQIKYNNWGKEPRCVPLERGANHTRSSHGMCNQCLVFYVFNVKICINVANLEYIDMMPFVMYYGRMWNNLDLI